MSKKNPYEYLEESQSPQVQDDSVMEYATTTQLSPYTMEECLPPYTIQELNARIDEAEEQIARGDEIDADVFFAQVSQRIASRL